MDLEAGCSMTSAERGTLHEHIGHGNNQSQSVLISASTSNGLRQLRRSMNWIRVKGAGAMVNLAFLLRRYLRSLNWIRVKGAFAIIILAVLLVFGLMSVGLEVKLHEDHWLEGLGIVVAVLVHFSIEWSVHCLKHLLLSDQGGNLEGVEGSIGERPEMTKGQHQQIGEARMFILHADRSQLDIERLFVWWNVFFVFLVVVMFMIPLIHMLVERGLGLGLWLDVTKPGQDTVQRLAGIVKIIESVIVVWAVVVDEALSVVVAYKIVESLLCGPGRDNRRRHLMLQKWMQFQLVPILTILIVNFVAMVCTGDMSLTVAQLLWVHAVVRLGELCLAKEEPVAAALDDDNSKPLPISNTTWRNVIVLVFYLTGVLLVLHFKGTQLLQFFGIAGPNMEEINQTFRFNVLGFCIILNLVSCRRTEETNIVQGVLGNRLLLVVVGSTAFLQVLLVEFSGSFLSTVKLGWFSWMLCICVSLASLLLGWLFKQFCPVIPDHLQLRSLQPELQTSSRPQRS